MLNIRKKLYGLFDNTEGGEETIPDIFTMTKAEVIPDVMTIQKVRKVLLVVC